MRNFLFLLNHLACMYALHIAPGTTNVNPMQPNILMQDDRNLAKTKEPSIFCFTIAPPEEQEMIDLVIEQLSECNRYQVFSTFDDPDRGIVRLYDDMRQNKVGGYTNLTLLLAKAWDHIATSEKWGHIADWYVKVDPDTFFRPRHLRTLLLSEKINPSDVLGFGAQANNENPAWTDGNGVLMNSRFQGGMEVVSKAAFLNLRPIFRDPLAMYNPHNQTSGTTNEDVWLGDALRKIGGQVHPTPQKHGCHTTLMRGPSGPFKKRIKTACEDKHSRFYQAGFCVIQEYEDVISLETLKDGFVLQEDAGDEDDAHFCLSEDIIALHPIKDPNLYKQLQIVDAMLLQKELTAR